MFVNLADFMGFVAKEIQEKRFFFFFFDILNFWARFAGEENEEHD